MKKKIVQLFLLLGLFGAVVFGQEQTKEQEEVQQSLPSTGMAKPLADLRDYNGTYEGSDGTGSIG